MNEMKRPLDSGFFQFIDQRGSVSDTTMRSGRIEKSALTTKKHKQDLVVTI